MKYIVSANYRDRKSPYKWLVRREDEGASEAKAYKHVEASGVEFRESSAYEEGFGCRVVAWADEANASGQDPVEDVERLTFDYNRFATQTGETVKRCQVLTLTPTGEMIADGIETE